MKRSRDLMALSIKTGMMLGQANMVIAMRMMGIAGAWNVSPAENRRMVHEKRAVAVESGAAMTRAVMTGKGPVALAKAGLAPIARRTGANAKRLAKRGPKVP
jgi:hypothetical protein